MPVACINSWQEKNPTYEVAIWGNDDITQYPWLNRHKIEDMLAKKDYAGASDVMRYEILYNHGGVYIDADSYCVKPLEDWLLNCEAFTAWEQEVVRNNLLANGFLGGVPKAPVWKACIDAVGTKDCKENKLAWLITGPMLLTEVFFNTQPNLTIYPSHYFLPEHHTGYKSKVTGNVFANHLWGSEIGYDNMNERVKNG